MMIGMICIKMDNWLKLEFIYRYNGFFQKYLKKVFFIKNTLKGKIFLRCYKKMGGEYNIPRRRSLGFWKRSPSFI